jgi:hypothetical protein
LTPIPITPAIIKQVNRIAKMGGMPKGLKITNHTGQVLYDSAWIAGVEYDEDEIEDQDYQEEQDEDDDSNYTMTVTMTMMMTMISMTKWIQMKLLH